MPISFVAVLRVLLAPIKRLLGHPEPTSTRAANPPGATQPKTVPKTAPRERNVRSARGGKYDARLLQIVAREPGITVAQAAAQLGLPASGLYPTIRRLQTKGDLVKQGRGLHPAG